MSTGGRGGGCDPNGSEIAWGLIRTQPRPRRAGTPSSIPRTLMSSSMSGQRMPVPSAMSTQRWRCSGVASDSRHDHARGTLMLRPSVRCAVIRSSVTSTVLARGSRSGLATVLTPRLQHLAPELKHDPPNRRKVVTGETLAANALEGIQPYLTACSIALDVDVRSLVAVEAVEIEPKWAWNPWDGRHRRYTVRPRRHLTVTAMAPDRLTRVRQMPAAPAAL